MCDHQRWYVCVFVCEQLPGHNSTPILTKLFRMFVYGRNRHQNFIFGYLGQRSRDIYVTVKKKTELFLAQATLPDSPAILAQALLLETKHMLSSLYWMQLTE